MNLFKNRTILGVLCIVLSLGICFGVTPLFNNAISAKTSIVRVKSTINQGEQITSSMLETVEVGAYNLPSNIVIDENLIVGAYALADFYNNQTNQSFSTDKSIFDTFLPQNVAVCCCIATFSHFSASL